MIAHSLPGRDPALNLALEEALFRRMERQAVAGERPEPLLLLWRNAPAVIVGRHQNTRAEVCEAWLAAHAVPVVRRLSGGGAVYHDPGNLNCSFLAPAEYFPAGFARFLEPITAALRSFGLDPCLSGRNDVCVAGKKVSGSAQARGRGVILHHGTLLYDVDIEAMTRALSPDTEKLALKGISSVRSRVGNLKEMLPAGTDLAALEEALIRISGARREPPEAGVLAEAQELARKRYRCREWNYGASPAFGVSRKRRFAWGGVSFSCRVERGVIREASIRGDFFGQDIEALEGALAGARWEKEDVRALLLRQNLAEKFYGCEPVELAEFLAGAAEAGEEE